MFRVHYKYPADGLKKLSVENYSLQLKSFRMEGTKQNTAWKVEVTE